SFLVGRLLAALVDRQEAILDRHRQNAHCGAVGGAIALWIGPGARPGLGVPEWPVQGGAEEIPVVCPGVGGGMGAIVKRIEEERAAGPARWIAEQEVAGPLHFRRVMLALTADLQGQNAGAGTGNGHSPVRHVAKAAGPAILRTLDVLDGPVDAF